jgi:uncharacterized protein
VICLVVIKAVRSCNLRCPYCYYINDDTENYGTSISEATLRAFYSAVAAHLDDGDVFEFVWHGGEPLILGKKRFRRFVEIQRDYLSHSQAHNVMQSNGTLLDEEWADLLEELNVGVGISLDGPPEVHDRRRPKVNGRGSYAEVLRGIRLLQDRGQQVAVLAVADPTADGAAVIRHFSELGITSCDLLIPITNNCVEATHVTPSDFAQKDALARYMVDAFREWSEHHASTMAVELFDTMLMNAVGFPHGNLNAASHNFSENVILESDGTLCIDPDFWHIDRFGFGEVYRLRTSVHDPKFSLADVEASLKAFADHNGLNLLPDECQKCSMRSICRASHPASRYGLDGSFNHRSAYCTVTFALSQEILRYLVNHGGTRHLVDEDLRRFVLSNA